jgi:phosphatidylglycerol:prolipoprotein diacylglycerol transferase
VWIEGLRLDPLCLFTSQPLCLGGLRMAQVISVLLIAVASVALAWIYGLGRPLPDPAGQPGRVTS